MKYVPQSSEIGIPSYRNKYLGLTKYKPRFDFNVLTIHGPFHGIDVILFCK